MFIDDASGVYEFHVDVRAGATPAWLFWADVGAAVSTPPGDDDDELPVIRALPLEGDGWVAIRLLVASEDDEWNLRYRGRLERNEGLRRNTEILSAGWWIRAGEDGNGQGWRSAVTADVGALFSDGGSVSARAGPAEEQSLGGGWFTLARGDVGIEVTDPDRQVGDVTVVMAVASLDDLDGAFEVLGSEGVTVLDARAGGDAAVVPLRDFDGDLHAQADGQVTRYPLASFDLRVGAGAQASAGLVHAVEIERSLFGWYWLAQEPDAATQGGYRDPSGATHEATDIVFAHAGPGEYTFRVDRRVQTSPGWIFWADVQVD